jgi:uncharacterized phiE125 gp8 family phage protein
MNRVIKQINSNKNEIISLKKAKNYLRIDHNHDDELIAEMIEIATESAENYLGSKLQKSDWKITIYDNFTAKINLIHNPISEVKQIKINRLNQDAVYLAKEAYYFKQQYLYIKNYSQSFVSAEITYTVGYEKIPLTITQGILEHLAKLYDLRGSDLSMPFSAKSLYQSHKLVRF